MGMAASLDLTGDNVFAKEVSVMEVRNLDEALSTKLEEWLDEAQAKVFTGEAKEAYLVIKIIHAE
jgi:hypothetical protein